MIQIPRILHNQKFIITNEKIPKEVDWQSKNNYLVNDISFQDHLSTKNTYGVLCGYNNLFVIDLDNEELQKELLSVYPDIFNNTFRVKSGGKGLYHFYFKTNITPESFKCLNEDKETLLDAQGIGKQVIGANSKLSNGGKYEVDKDVPILEINYNILKDILIKYDKRNTVLPQREENTNPNYESSADAEKIKSKLKIKDLLSEWGINTRKNPTECPFHSSKNGKCFSYTNDLFHCFHCEEKGDVIHLYQKKHNLSIGETFKQLKDKCGITKKEQKNKNKDEEAIKEYLDLDIKRYVIYKSGEETQYRIYINDFYLTLRPNDILSPNSFRKALFNEVGRLLSPITNKEWIELVNEWVNKYGQMEENKEVNSDNYITETIINEIQNFIIIDEPKLSVSYGRLLYLYEEPDVVYCCNTVLDTILRKNQFKINLTKLKILLNDYLKGNSKQIRTGKVISRFFRFRIDKLNELDTSTIQALIGGNNEHI